ncbi:MAG: redoxin domain-containing protein, partial [Phycisphaerales bacterium]|nr:redoxin domain-containing protein [Phycisphaerales bacterium]
MKNLLNTSIVALSLAAGLCVAAHHAPSATAAAYAAPVKVGETAPDFALKDTEGKEVKLSDFKGKIVVLEWFNPGCPFIVKHHEKMNTMTKLAKDYKDKDV